MIRLRPGTVGARFTALYALVFLLSGAALLGLTFVLAASEVSNSVPAAEQPDVLDAAQQRIQALEDQLATEQSQQSRQLLGASLVALILMAVVSVILGRILARRVLRPLRHIASATRRISADSLDQRLGVGGPDDEVKELADTVDELLGRLEASFAAQRRFVANASHELRTPLATMRASLDVAVAKPDPAASTVVLADRLRTQLDRVEHLLDGFLVLARAQHGAFADAESVDLSDLVRDAVRDREADVATKALHLTVSVPEGAVVEGSPALLARLVDNLVDNAVTHNEAGGWIAISVAMSPRSMNPGSGTAGSGTAGSGTAAVLTVETGGRVLDQRAVDRLAQPFERLGSERTGSSGLGLSIVAAVAQAHGGRLTLQAKAEGGLRAAIALPAATIPVPA